MANELELHGGNTGEITRAANEFAAAKRRKVEAKPKPKPDQSKSSPKPTKR